jgi:hypothetical protein
VTEEAIPDHAPQPQDARRAEADGFITIEQCGVQLRIPVKGKVPLKAYMLFVEGKELAGTAALLGPEQWEAFLAADPTVDDYSAIGQRIAEAAGN